MQAINYPTVARGEEKLRMAPTPHHTKPMMEQLLLDMRAIWNELGLPLKTPVCSSVRDKSLSLKRHEYQL